MFRRILDSLENCPSLLATHARAAHITTALPLVEDLPCLLPTEVPASRGNQFTSRSRAQLPCSSCRLKQAIDLRDRLPVLAPIRDDTEGQCLSARPGLLRRATVGEDTRD